jgi:superfamily II DNA or RNA helicase
VFQQSSLPGPLEPLPDLGEESCARFTEHLLLLAHSEKYWELAHATRPDVYPSLEVESPALWMMRQYGRLPTSKGIMTVNHSVGPKLARWHQFLPVANIDARAAFFLGLVEEPGELSGRLWAQALRFAAELDDLREVGRFYAYFCPTKPTPDLLISTIGTTRGSYPPSEITVAVHNDFLEASLKALQKPYITVDDSGAATALQTHWGLVGSDAVVSIEPKFVASGSELPMGDAYVGLSIRLTNDQSDLKLVPCSSLRREVISAAGTQSEEQEYFLEGTRLYYLDRLSAGEVLDEVVRIFNLQLTPYERDDVLSHRESEDARKQLTLIRDIKDLGEKLLACVGADALQRRLSEQVLEAARDRYSKLSDRVIAKVYLAVHGVESLIRLKEDLSRKGLTAPVQWAGTYTARKFVKDLGFPLEFAGFQSSDREPAIDIDGRPFLPPLHGFQDQAVTNIRALLLSKRNKRRGLLSLPTGAGKTRVAVEAFVRAIHEDDFPGPILWVAQSDELCEQAVQTWSEVWRALGPRRSLRINRLWAHNNADEWPNGPQVVVATMQKLQRIVENADYDWLKSCSALIVDEAHTAITKGYTAILEWAGSHGRRKYDRCPVIGLTATPFRGGVVETSRLASRFGSNRLDDGLFPGDPYRTLQTMGVLAAVKHQLLDGVEVSLTETELQDLRRNHLLPASAGDRLGANRIRNLTLLGSMKALPSDWPVLLFAVSVEHASTMSALLNADGISAAAISAETAPGARRHYIEKFRQGEIRVLTNYGVLTTGFDAPAVRAIYVARPTFSAGLYQQMIGRGLRGPLNQGKEECLIVNVKDTFEQFGEELAFTEFEYLWNPAEE